jgi:predicted phosphohydrolase
MRLAITADLHWGSRPAGDEATRRLAAFLAVDPPDVLVLAGDVGAADHFVACLELFDGLPSRKALVPGNHDVWVRVGDARGDSLRVYREHLPAVSAAHGFHYLDAGPLLFPAEGLALVGSMNWYDHSWSVEELRQRFPEEEHRLVSKHFTRGRHNDANFVLWPLDDAGFTREAVAALGRHLDEALAQVERAVVVTHHPPFRGLGFPQPEDRPPSLDRLLWKAFSGNVAVEELLRRHAERVPFAFCGHTHWEREGELAGIRGYNVGGDYAWKRLLVLDWPAGTVQAHAFGLEGSA